jgi:hypothetical protein
MNEKGLLERRVKRCIATILSAKEKNIDRFITEDTASEFRKVILDEINEFYSLVMDVLDDNINQEFLDMLDMLEDIHEALVKKE